MKCQVCGESFEQEDGEVACTYCRPARFGTIVCKTCGAYIVLANEGVAREYERTPTSCGACGGIDLWWYSHNQVRTKRSTSAETV